MSIRLAAPRLEHTAHCRVRTSGTPYHRFLAMLSGPVARLGTLLAILAATVGVAHATIIGIQSNSSVYSINETTGASTLLSANGNNSNAMARNSAGVLYVAGGLGNGRLDTINPTTGVLTAGPTITGPGDVRAMAFSSGNVLFAFDNDNGGRLYTINPATGAGTLIAGPLLGTGIQGMAFAPSGTLYGWRVSGGNAGGLIIIDPSTGAVTDVNPALGTSGVDIQTLTFSTAGVAYGGSSSLYTVDLTTGAPTLVGSLAPATDIRGMEFIAAAPPAPGVSLTPSPLAFGSLVVGTTSASQPLTLQNIGGAPLNIASIAASGDFAQTNTCGAVLAASATCSISVTFTPTAVGARSGSITVTSDATGSPHSATLSGTGTALPAGPVATLAPTGLVFGTQATGTSAPAQSLTVQNTGGSALNTASIVASGDFAQTNNCPASLAPVAFCTINVTFTPTAVGARNGAITVTSNGTGSPNAAALSGVGAGVPPVGPGPSSIPTLSQWGLIVLMIAVGIIGVQRRRRT